MAKQRINSHPTEAGNRLYEAILQNGYIGITQFANDLADEIADSEPQTIMTNLSNMINNWPVEKWNRKYFIGIERLLNVRIADIVDGFTSDAIPPLIGLYEVGKYGNYKKFEEFAKITDGYISVIDSADEFSKNIYDYVYEGENLEGLRYLVDHGYYLIFAPSVIQGKSYYAPNEIEHAITLLKIISKDSDEKYGLFKALFDTRKNTDDIDPEKNLFDNEEILDLIINSPYLLKAVCRGSELVGETTLNRVRREIIGDEFKAICASNWLTPLVCYALKNEEKYRAQAEKLLRVSLDIAGKTLDHIGNHRSELGGEGESISTKKGHVILGHSYVIGVIGEPSTEKEIKDPKLRKLANEITAKIGVFRAMAKIHTPVLIDGKMHMPRGDNQLYQKFIHAAKGHKFLLQESDNNDQYNSVFDMPQGKQKGMKITPVQWEQLGKALKSIHQIDCGQEGKVYCHDRFDFSDFYWLKNDDLELICGYEDVYIGSPEDDIFALGLLAFQNDIFMKDPQEELQAFLKGYGYPYEGFLEKFWDYIINRARKIDNLSEVTYLMNTAVGVRKAINESNG